MATAATDVTQDDPIETLYERGVTDGLPVVPPTRQRVERMLAGAPRRLRDELIGLLGPQMGRATVEKVAIKRLWQAASPNIFPSCWPVSKGYATPPCARMGLVLRSCRARRWRL